MGDTPYNNNYLNEYDAEHNYELSYNILKSINDGNLKKK